jgi:hypothetical protein
VTLPRLELRLPDGPEQADLELVRILGEGGMGVVWLARQRTLARDVAVERLEREASSEASEALLAEARATGAVEHPSVVPVYALGSDDSGTPMLVMKRLEGESRQTLVGDPAHPAWPALERRDGDRLGAIAETGAAAIGGISEVLVDACASSARRRDGLIRATSAARARAQRAPRARAA